MSERRPIFNKLTIGEPIHHGTYDNPITVGEDRLLTKLRAEFGEDRNEVYPGSCVLVPRFHPD